MWFGAKSAFTVETLGSSVLRQTAAPVPAVTPEIRALAERMLATLRAFDGIGLAAPQIGEPLRLVVFDVPADSMSENPTAGELELLPKMPLAVVNPEILEFDDSVLVRRDEGCLSLPELWAPVVRPHRVVFRATALDGSPIVVECGGLLGRCIQHELDHLEGKLFIDRVAEADRPAIAAKMRKIEKFGARHDYQRKITV